MIGALATTDALPSRRPPRTSLFVMATLFSDFGSMAVKVRDLSTDGALVEGGALPEASTQVRLCRGPLAVTGTVIWKGEGRAGLRFDTTINVADWLPSARAAAGQQRVDEIVQQLKVPGTAIGASAVPHHAAPPPIVTKAELRALRAAIEALADDLAADSEVLERHLTKLQTLDLASQLLGKLISAD